MASVVSSRDRPNLRAHRCGHMMRWSESVSDPKSETDGGKRREEHRPSLSYFHTSSLNQCCKKRRVSTDRCFSSVSDRLGSADCMKQYCNIPKIKVRQVKSNLFMTHIHRTPIIGETMPVMQFKCFWLHCNKEDILILCALIWPVKEKWTVFRQVFQMSIQSSWTIF